MVSKPIHRDTRAAIRHFNNLENEGKASGSRLKNFLKTVFTASLYKGAIDGVLRSVKAMGRGIKNYIKDSLNIHADLEKTMDMVGLKAGLNESSKQFKELNAMAREFGAMTATSASRAAKGLLEFASAGALAGKSTQEIKTFMSTAINASIAHNMDMGKVASLTVATISAGFKDLLVDGKKSYDSIAKMMDIFTKAGDKSTMSLQMFQQVFGKVGATASLAGISFTETTTALSKLKDSGLTAGDAAFKLKQMIDGLSSPSAKAKKSIKSLNMSVKDIRGADGKLKSLADIMDTLRVKSDAFIKKQLQSGKSLAQATQTAETHMKAILLKGGLSAYKALAGGGKKAIEEFRNFNNDLIKNASGTLDKYKERAEKTYKGIKASMMSAVEETQHQTAEGLKSGAKGIMSDITKDLQELNKSGKIKMFFKDIGDAARAIWPYIRATGKFIVELSSSVIEFGREHPTLMKMIAGFAALAIIGGKLSSFTSGLGVVKQIFPAFAAGPGIFSKLATSILSAGKAVLVFLATNPVGWAILAASAIAGVAIAWHQNSSRVKELTGELSKLQPTAKNAASVLGKASDAMIELNDMTLISAGKKMEGMTKGAEKYSKALKVMAKSYKEVNDQVKNRRGGFMTNEEISRIDSAKEKIEKANAEIKKLRESDSRVRSATDILDITETGKALSKYSRDSASDSQKILIARVEEARATKKVFSEYIKNAEASKSARTEMNKYYAALNGGAKDGIRSIEEYATLYVKKQEQMAMATKKRMLEDAAAKATGAAKEKLEKQIGAVKGAQFKSAQDVARKSGVGMQTYVQTVKDHNLRLDLENQLHEKLKVLNADQGKFRLKQQEKWAKLRNENGQLNAAEQKRYTKEQVTFAKAKAQELGLSEMTIMENFRSIKYDKTIQANALIEQAQAEHAKNIKNKLMNFGQDVPEAVANNLNPMGEMVKSHFRDMGASITSSSEKMKISVSEDVQSMSLALMEKTAKGTASAKEKMTSLKSGAKVNLKASGDYTGGSWVSGILKSLASAYAKVKSKLGIIRNLFGGSEPKDPTSPIRRMDKSAIGTMQVYKKGLDRSAGFLKRATSRTIGEAFSGVDKQKITPLIELSEKMPKIKPVVAEMGKSKIFTNYQKSCNSLSVPSFVTAKTEQEVRTIGIPNIDKYKASIATTNTVSTGATGANEADLNDLLQLVAAQVNTTAALIEKLDSGGITKFVMAGNHFNSTNESEIKELVDCRLKELISNRNLGIN